MKPVYAILEKRQAEADKLFLQADEKEAQAKKSCDRYETLLLQVQEEKEKITVDAREEAAREYSRIVAQAKIDAEELVEHARAEAVKEKEVMIQQTDSEIRELVLDMAVKLMGSSEKNVSDRQMYDRFLSCVEGQETQRNGV